MAGSDGDIGAGTDAGADADVPPGLKLGFWRIVLLLNFGPIAITVGVMLAVFGGYVIAGTVAVAAGVVALGFAGYLYKKYSEEYIENRNVEKD